MFSSENKKVLVAFLFWEGGRRGGGGGGGVEGNYTQVSRINERMGHAAVSPVS